MDQIILCEICGSENVKEKILKQTYKETYGSSVEIDEKFFECEDCQSTWEDFEINGKNAEDAINKSKKDAIKNIIDYLNNNDLSLSYIERALKLPQRTLTKWKSSDNVPGAGSFALMNIIRTYPWIIKVADHNYEPSIANQEMVMNSVQILLNSFEKKYPQFNDRLMKTLNDNISIYQNFVFTNQIQKTQFMIEQI